MAASIGKPGLPHDTTPAASRTTHTASNINQMQPPTGETPAVPFFRQPAYTTAPKAAQPNSNDTIAIVTLASSIQTPRPSFRRRAAQSTTHCVPL